MANISLALASLRAAATVDQRSVCVWVFVLTLALSWVVRAETFSWDASSSRRSFRICGRQEERRQKTINKDGDKRILELSSSNKHGSAEMFWWAEEDWEDWEVWGGLGGTGGRTGRTRGTGGYWEDWWLLTGPDFHV